jgi:secreted trypsin-like serine protease
MHSINYTNLGDMVVAENINYAFHQASAGRGYDGVCMVSANGYYGTGVLLYSGHAILTAAHVLEQDGGGWADEIQVAFETSGGDTEQYSTQYLVHPDYDPVNGNNDLALIFLSNPVDTAAERYQIYRNSDDVGSQATLVGYGSSGIGITGSDPESVSERYKSLNTLDITAGEFLQELGRTVGWKPDPDNLILADFDSGYADNDIIGRISGDYHLGTGSYEGIIGPGDSGGPAFVDGMIAGIANYIVHIEGEFESADIDDELNSSFGEVAFWLRVSEEQEWIDRSMRQNYPDSPQSPNEVEKSIIEGSEGVSLLYFMVQFHGERDTPQQIVSVDYATRNGSAEAGEDYLAVSGTLNLYPEENQALIPVEIVGDIVEEEDETFFLDVFNPVGGTFAGEVDTLTAMRTIIDDAWA